MKKKIIILLSIIIVSISAVFVTKAIEPIPPKHEKIPNPLDCSSIAACDPTIDGVCLLMTCEMFPYKPL